uniref:FBD domain-containing protein n=1 Tax=Oryza barthii TaxID=65489 RepID=A0A0D3HPC7_9ORYZ
MEVTAPRLRSFTYKGEAVRFDLTSPPPTAPDTTVVTADLHFTHGLGRCVYPHFIHNFTNARVLRLKANHLDDMAVAEVFPDLEHLRLELDGAYSGWSMAAETAAATIAGLLHCCPVLRQLELNFISDLPPDSSCKNTKQVKHLFQKKCDADFEKSIDDFMRLIKFKSKQRLDIPGLSDCSFACLKSSLRRVSLQFRLGEDSDCFGVRLIKFFAENAMFLEELHILTVETESSTSI